MKIIPLVSLCVFLAAAHTWAADSARISATTRPELPAGVPRTVDTNGHIAFIDPTFSTPAYQAEVFRLVMQEANRVARELNLHEALPITVSNLTRAYISRFGSAYATGALGNITTSNYSYGAERDYRFSQLTAANLDDRCREYSRKYQWPIARLATNAAYLLAVSWLESIHVDVGRLNRDCDVEIALDHYWNGVKNGEIPRKTFTPLYFISWNPRSRRGEPGGGAYVELFLPTKTLLQMKVYDAKYILCPPLMPTNLGALFPGRGVVTTNKVDSRPPPRLGPA
jgi:hypothetical protein